MSSWTASTRVISCVSKGSTSSGSTRFIARGVWLSSASKESLLPLCQKIANFSSGAARYCGKNCHKMLSNALSLEICSNTRRMDKDDPRRLAIVQYQREAVDVLYNWAAAPQVREAPSAKLVPSEPIVEPARPAADASLADWHEYYVRMAAVLQWQMEVEAWRSGIEDRLEGLEAITGLIPDILERLPAPTITPAHQHQVKYYVSQLSQATIYGALYTSFDVPRYQELLAVPFAMCDVALLDAV